MALRGARRRDVVRWARARCAQPGPLARGDCAALTRPLGGARALSRSLESFELATPRTKAQASLDAHAERMLLAPGSTNAFTIADYVRALFDGNAAILSYCSCGGRGGALVASARVGRATPGAAALLVRGGALSPACAQGGGDAHARVATPRDPHSST
jgi:hypothetical protein